jgi:hypothetical protein
MSGANEGSTLDFHGDVDSKTSQYYVGQGAMNSTPVGLEEAKSSMSTATYDSSMPWTRFFCCIPVTSYQRYFDFDTDDIVQRVKGSIIFANTPNHFRENIIGTQMDESSQTQGHSSSIHKGPDLYAPIWVTLTLVFFIASTSNATAYIHKGRMDDFEYDISHVANAMILLFSFVLGLPTFFHFVLKCIRVNMEWVDLVCLYGYSLVPYIPASLLCLLPSVVLEWILLLSATVLSVLLILRNIASPIIRSSDAHARSYASAVLMAVMLFHLAFVLILKFSFYHHPRGHSSSPSGGTSQAGTNDDAGAGEPGSSSENVALFVL